MELLCQISDQKLWCIVTPYAGEPVHYIQRCVDSVVSATERLRLVDPQVSVEHLIVPDGISIGERPLSHLVSVLQLPLPTRDFGDTPRAVGSVFAISRGAWAISYLDADNWFDDEHLNLVWQKHLSVDAAVVTTKRRFVSMDGASLGAICLTSNGEVFCDTNCLSLFGGAVKLGFHWGLIHPAEHAIDDRVIWREVCKSGFKRAHIERATVSYRVSTPGIYRDLGKTPPEHSRPSRAIADALNHYAQRTGERLSLNWKYLLT